MIHYSVIQPGMLGLLILSGGGHYRDICMKKSLNKIIAGRDGFYEINKKDNERMSDN